jgi:SAM-dependent methyltransferase
MKLATQSPQQQLLGLYEKSPLKKAKFAAIEELLPDTSGMVCLDIGADNGVLSYLLRQRGGEWHSADLDEDVVAAIKNMVGDQVHQFDGGPTEFPDDYFDLIVIIDFLEHIEDDSGFIEELSRIMKPGGVLIVNVPHYKGRSPIRRLRLAVGLTDDKHGHVRPGYTMDSLAGTLLPNFIVEKRQTYSRFFVELFDVAVSWYLDRAKHGDSSRKGNVVTAHDMSTHRKQFKLYSLIYPLVWCLGQADRLLFFTSGYSVVVRARASAEATS